MNKHKNIPIFIPHQGCRHDCVFCSQEKITGVSRFDNEIVRIKEIFEASHGCEGEIAFFGGSFTALGYERMTSLLETAKPYIQQGITGIRISTRPDCIDDEICRFLKNYGVTSVELGIQSTDNTVLAASRRGHTAEHSEKACRTVKKHGFTLVGQMMVGLPESTLGSELQTAKNIILWGAEEARIYPTAVFEGTPLWEKAESGDYIPLTNEEAVERTALCAEIFIENSIKLLKIGLHSSPELKKARGANHPALGELAAAKIYLKNILKSTKNADKSKILTIFVPAGAVSKAAGHKRENIKILESQGFLKIKIKEDNSLSEYNIRTKQD